MTPTSSSSNSPAPTGPSQSQPKTSSTDTGSPGLQWTLTVYQICVRASRVLARRELALIMGLTPEALTQRMIYWRAQERLARIRATRWQHKVKLTPRKPKRQVEQDQVDPATLYEPKIPVPAHLKKHIAKGPIE